MRLRFEQGRHSDEGICAVGRWDYVKILAGKWGKDPTPPPAPFRSLFKNKGAGPSSQDQRYILRNFMPILHFYDCTRNRNVKLSEQILNCETIDLI